jgi:hypothetical protein
MLHTPKSQHCEAKHALARVQRINLIYLPHTFYLAPHIIPKNNYTAILPRISRPTQSHMIHRSLQRIRCERRPER